MNRRAISSNGSEVAPSANTRTRQRRYSYHKVKDARKHPVRGLWRRNGRYYAQVTVEDPISGLKRVKRVPLSKASTDAQAIEAFEDFKSDRRRMALPILKRAPKFEDAESL